MKTHKLAFAMTAALSLTSGLALAAAPDGVSASGGPTISADMPTRPTSKDMQETIVTLHNVLRADPKNYDAHLKLGEIYLDLNEPAEAIKQFTAALPSSDHDAPAKQGLGLAFLRLGDNQSAQRYFTEALAGDEKLWRAQLGLAELADAARDWAAAEKFYQAAIAVSPQSAAIYNNLGLSYTRQRRYDEAIAQFQKSLGLRAAPAVRANLRFVLAMKGDYLTALAGVSRENLPDALNNVGYAAMLRGDYDTAEAYLTRAVEARPSFHTQAVDNLRMLKDLREAKKAAAAKPAHTASR